MKTFTRAIAVVFFFIGSAGFVSAQSAYKVKSSTGANLRQGPATGKEVITTMPVGAKVSVVEKTNDGWYKVEYNGKTGYVSSALVEEDINQANSSSANNSPDNNSASNTRSSNNNSPAAEKNNSSNSGNSSRNTSSNSNKNKSNTSSSRSKNSGSSAAYKWGIGLRLGEPAGISIKKYNSGNTAWEVNLGRASRWGHHYDKDDFYKYSRFSNTNNYYYSGYAPGFTTALQVRYMWSKPINGAEGLSFYYGGGLQARFTPVTYRYYYYDGSFENDWWKDSRYYREDRVTDIDLGLDGVLGLEYMMKDLPLSFFLDVNLFVEIVDTPFIIYPQGGAGVRYNF
jgi:uncharacterized protein YraI